MALVNKNAAVIIEDKDLNGERLGEEINKLMSDKTLLNNIGKMRGIWQLQMQLRVFVI